MFLLFRGRRLLTGVIAILLCLSLVAAADTMVLPQAMKVIGEEAFYGAVGLSSVVVPEGVIRIEARAFADSSLREIDLPSTLESLAADAFAGTQLERVAFQDGITQIEADTFAGLPLREIELPGTIDAITADLFAGTQLERVFIGEGTTQIGARAFAGLPLHDLELPGSVGIIAEEAFCGTQLENVTVPSGIVRIEARAFADSPLREIALPATLEFIAEDAFDGTQLERIEAPADSYAREWAKEHGYFEEYAEPQVSNADKIETVIAAGVAVLGAKYKYSGSGPTTFDCSGFVRYCYAKAGVSLPHNSTAISNLTEYTRFTSLGNLKRGDIVCFAFDSKTVDHVAIYMGDGYIIEASSGAGCVRKKYVSNNTYYKTHVARCVRIFD